LPDPVGTTEPKEELSVLMPGFEIGKLLEPLSFTELEYAEGEDFGFVPEIGRLPDAWETDLDGSDEILLAWTGTLDTDCAGLDTPRVGLLGVAIEDFVRLLPY